MRCRCDTDADEIPMRYDEIPIPMMIPMMIPIPIPMMISIPLPMMIAIPIPDYRYR